jgi:acetyltransferase-like isoleucine patch superfamily enzyme
MTKETPLLQPLTAGSKLHNDWFNGTIPANIRIGENVMIESSFSFKHFFSTRPIGLYVGNNVTLWRTALSTEANGIISIGEDCYFANAALVCSERISIGSRVFIAGGVSIADSDFHPLDPAMRLADTIALSPAGNSKNRPLLQAKPVVIEDDVWIGVNAAILKGVRIGEGAVIQPGAMVTEDVPAGATVAGNPAKPVNWFQ